MTATLISARVGAGKTEAAQARLLALKRDNPLAKVWALLATERQVVDFRRRLIDAAPDGILFNIEFFSFYNLYRHLLASAGVPSRGIDDLVRDGLLRVLLEQMSAGGDLPLLGQIAATRGLIRAVGGFIYELKQNVITPEVFSQAAGALPDEDAVKIRELAAIYARYQALLREYKVVDREGEGWLALAELRREDQMWIASDVDLLIVDGYDQFNVLQADLLALLAGRARETLITLTSTADDDPTSAATIGRRFQRARELLDDRFQRAQQPLRVLGLDAEGGRARSAALRHLSANLMQSAAVQPSGGAVRLVEAPDRALEVGAVLRRVKRLLLDGAAPDSILIALRDYAGYAPLFAAQGRELGLPLALHYGDPIDGNPAVVALLDLLTLHEIDFGRRELLDVLRSPYFRIPKLDAEAVEHLEAISALVMSGRSEWLGALDAAAKAANIPDADDERDMLALTPERAAQLRAALAAFFDAVVPPETGALPDYVRWLEDLIGYDAAAPDERQDERDNLPPEDAPPTGYTLALPDRLRDLTTPADLQARDLAAVGALQRRLRVLLQADALFWALGLPRLYDRAAFMAEMRAVIASGAVDARQSRDGRVLVTTAADARGLPHAHVFILSLSEGMFPAPPPQDRLLLDSERRYLIAEGAQLGLREEKADDDGVFYELINLASESLTLSRPYTADGALLAESHLWRATTALFDDLIVERLPLGAAVAPAEVATAEQAALAVTAAPGTPETDALYAWLREHHTDLWARIASARAVERMRMGMGDAFARHDGRLLDTALIAAVAALIVGRTWSASQLNELGTCAYRFFAHRLLRLEAIRRPEEGMDVLQRGSLLHEILEAVYERLRRDQAPIHADQIEAALALVEREADRLLADAPARHGFRAPATWAQEKQTLKRLVAALIQADFGENSPLDRAFGAGRRVVRVEQAFDADLPLLQTGTLRVRGVIDRIDQVNGQHVVIDYKSGSTPISLQQLRRGRNVQMGVYLLAAEIALGLAVDGGAFWHLPDRRLSGTIFPHDADERGDDARQALDGAKARLSRVIAAAARGDFTAEPNGRESGQCARSCDYAQLCRIALRGKASRANDG
jgi:ATP-dependent helicase/DNAse subunit B